MHFFSTFQVIFGLKTPGMTIFISGSNRIFLFRGTVYFVVYVLGVKNSGMTTYFGPPYFGAHSSAVML